jgi:hypothetical protein
MAQKSVTVTIGGSISVSPDTVPVKKNQDTVLWEGTSATEFNIVFQGSGEPTVSCSLQNGKWTCTAGPFQNTGNSNRRVKYNVTSQGKPTLDPEVEVQT